ncbi:ribosome maturation factor RimM [soil metagenome]
MELIQVGKVHKVHGIRGWLKITFSYPLTALWVDDLPPLLIGTEAKNLPYFPEEINGTGDDQYLLKLEELNNPEEAALLPGKAIYMQDDKVKEYFFTDMEESAYDFAVGYMLFSETGEFVGTIESIEAMPAHDLAQITYRGREVLLPLADELVQAVDHKAKSIKLIIPEGLLSI